MNIMTMNKTILFAAFFLLTVAVSCKEENIGPAVENYPPEITFDSEDNIYTVKAGKEIRIAPAVSHAENAVYSWRTETETLSEDSVFVYVFDEPGQVFVTLTVTTEYGQDSEEIRIDVASLVIPEISLTVPDGGYNIALGSELKIIPAVRHGDVSVFSWKVNGIEVSSEPEYLFVGETIGTFDVEFTATAEDGSDMKAFAVNVLDPSEIPFEWTFENDEFNVSQGRRIRIRPYNIKNAEGAVYSWSVDGEEVQSGSEAMFIFEASEEGVYKVTATMSNSTVKVDKHLTVNVCPVEGTYRRPSTGNADWDRVYEFLPAPGQFVNENYTATTMEEAVQYAEGRLEAQQYVSLGGFGGYIVIGFDHSVENSGSYDFQIIGNSFDGSSEPGIVWVMQDENGNGLPDDTWYELKGSEYGKPETISDYEVTYYRPSAPQMPVQWTDNFGNSGEIDYLAAFHRQDYYYPAWVEDDTYVLKGTRLEPRTEMITENYWVNNEYEWGYADNFSPIDRLTDDDNYNAGANANHFRISDAVTFDGQPANLGYIDFIKVVTGVNVKAGWLGENSTEVFGARDYHLVPKE